MDDLLTRQVPYSAEAEQAVLGSVLIDPEKTGDLMELLTPGDFYLEVNKIIGGTDTALTIPMKEGQRSLNLSNSVSIVAYEHIRQVGL